MRHATVFASLLFVVACGRVGYAEMDAGRELDARGLDAPGLDAGLDAFTIDAPPGLDAPTFVPDAFALDASALDVRPDTNEPDSGVFAVPCPLEAIFCDGYDDPSLSAWSYSVIHDGVAERVFEPVHTGIASLHCQTDGTAWAEARYSADVFGGQTTGDLWTRAFFLLPTGVDGTFSIESISERTPPYAGTLVFFQGGVLGVRVGATGPLALAAAPFPRGTFVCVETHIAIAAAGRAEVFVDGVFAAGIDTDTSMTTGYDIAEIGLHFNPAGSPVELWVDDVALSRVRTGCL